MNRFKIVLTIILFIVIGLISPPSVSVSAEDNLVVEERDEKLTTVYMNRKDISIDDLKNSSAGTLKYSVEFRGKDCFLILIPAPEINDPIGITVSNIDDDIGITGKEYNKPKNPIISRSTPKVLEKYRSEEKK